MRDRDEYGLVQVTPPAYEPVGLLEAKAQCRVEEDASDESAYIESLITAARQRLEKETGRSFVEQTWRLSMDRFPCWDFRLPRGPLLSVSSITYVDTGGTTQTLATSAYEVDTDSDPGRVQPSYAHWWPAVRVQANAVKVTYTAGYGADVAVPQPIKQAILLLAAHWFENREPIVTGTIATELPLSAKWLVEPYTSPDFFG